MGYKKSWLRFKSILFFLILSLILFNATLAIPLAGCGHGDIPTKINAGDNGQFLDTSLLDCIPKTYLNVTAYLDATIIQYQNYLEFYTALHHNFVNIKKSCEEQCNYARKLNKRFRELYYMQMTLPNGKPANTSPPKCGRQVCGSYLTCTPHIPFEFPTNELECGKKRVDYLDTYNLNPHHKVMNQTVTACSCPGQITKSIDFMKKNILDLYPELINELKKMRKEYEKTTAQGKIFSSTTEYITEIVETIEEYMIRARQPVNGVGVSGFQGWTKGFIQYFKDKDTRADITDKPWYSYVFTHRFRVRSDLTPDDLKKYKYDVIACCSVHINADGCSGLSDGTGEVTPKMSFPCFEDNLCIWAGQAPIGLESEQMDTWVGASINNLKKFDHIHPNDVFVKNATCLLYLGNTSYEPNPCRDVCETCYHTSESHCHAQYSVCVCEKGEEWYTVNQACTSTKSKPSTEKCCTQLFEEEGKTQTSLLYFEGTNQCSSQPVIKGSYYDYCNGVSSETGLCCYYGFATKEINKNTCDFIDKKEGCRKDGVDNGLACPTNKNKKCCDGLCMDASYVCKHVPKLSLSVNASLIRQGIATPAYYEEDDLVLQIKCENTAKTDGLGLRAVVYLITHYDCVCPTSCKKSEICACSCKEKRDKIYTKENINIKSGQVVTIQSLPYALTKGHVNTLVQGEITLYNAKDQIVAQKKSQITRILEKESFTITDAFFMFDGQRVHEIVPESLINAFIKADSQFFPLKIKIRLVDENNKVIENTENEYDINSAIKDGQFGTDTFTVPRNLAKGELKIQISIYDENDKLLEEYILSSNELIASSPCNEKIVDYWCNNEISSVKINYPGAKINIIPYSLDINTYGFQTLDSIFTRTITSNNYIQSTLTLYNPMPISFEGDITLYVKDETGTPVIDIKKQVTGTNSEFRAGNSFSIETNPFIAVYPKKYTMSIIARDSYNANWIEKDLEKPLFTIPQFSLPEPTPIPSAVPGITVFPGGILSQPKKIRTRFKVGQCTINLACDDCIPTCNIVVDSQHCSLVYKESCDCHCKVT